jgi:(S)-ureidoglycine aminohydrolase
MAPETVSFLPDWHETKCWILVSPAIGHGAAFAQYLLHIEPGGGSGHPEQESGVEGFLFVLEGAAHLEVEGEPKQLPPGGYAFLPSGMAWSLKAGSDGLRCLWIRKAYEPYDGPKPNLIVCHENDADSYPGPGTDRKSTKFLIPRDDIAHDFQMTIVTFEPGSSISTPEAHVMEHGLYLLQGKGVYLLNEIWHEVRAGHFIWMKAFCPQAFFATGESTSRYLLYKNVNRQIRLTSPTSVGRDT